MRPPVRWMCAAAFIMCAGLLVEGLPASSASTLAHEFTPYASSQSTDVLAGVSGAAVLLQLADCTGNLRMLDLLNRRAVRDGIHLRVLWYTGPVADSSRIRAALPAFAQAIPLVPATPAVIRAFAALGHITTPTLAVLDPFGRVRLATQAPRSSREYVALRNIIEGLSWNEEH